MLFTFEITIPASTPLNAPKIVVFPLTKGLIHQLDVYFPPGNAAEAYITINRGVHQIFPTNPDGYLKGNDVLLSGDVFHYLGEAPYEVELRGYSPNATYDHTVYVSIWVKHPWQISPFSDEMFNLILEDSLPIVPPLEGGE